MIEKITAETSNKIANMSFMCAALVLMIHTERTADCYSVNWLNGAVSQIGVPFFFAVSGFLLLNRFGSEGWYKDALIKRFHSLFIPFVCLNICWFPIKYAIHYVGYIHFGADHSNPTMVLSFVNFLRAFSPIAVYGSPCVGPLWYVRALMWLVVFSPIMAYFICKSKKSCGFWMTIVAIVWILQIGGIIQIPFRTEQAGLDYSLRCLFYFSLGMMVRKWNLWNISKRVGIPSLIIGIILSFACLFVMFEGRAYIQTIAVLLIIIGTWWATPANDWPKHLTKNSYVIFALHTILMYLGHTGLKALKLTSYLDHGLGVWLLAALYLCLCCLIGNVIRNKMPRISAIFFGGR